MIGAVRLNKNPVVDFRVIRQGRISSRYRDYLESSLLGKIKKVQIMSTDLAFELLPAQDMDEVDRLLAEVEAPEQELVQI